MDDPMEWVGMEGRKTESNVLKRGLCRNADVAHGNLTLLENAGNGNLVKSHDSDQQHQGVGQHITRSSFSYAFFIQCLVFTIYTSTLQPQCPFLESLPSRLAILSPSCHIPQPAKMI